MSDEFRTLVESIVRDVLATLAPSKPANDAYLSVEEAGELARVTPGTVRRWVRTKRLKRYEAGAHLRIRRDDLEKFLRGNAVMTPAERAAMKFAAKK